MCDRGCFSQMGDVFFVSLRVSKLQKLEKGSILQVHKWSSPCNKSCSPPPPIKAWPLCSSQWMKGHKVWLKPKALVLAYTQARWKTCCGIFCSRFHPILSPLKIISEMVFWTNLMLDLTCTWLEKTRRFCRQVNKKISSCFWTASTCVQRSLLGWCSRWMSDDSTLGQLDYRQLDYLTTRLMGKSTHGQVDSLTTRPIVIIHVRGIIFLPKSLNVMSSCTVKRSVQSPRRNKSRKCNEIT